MPLLWSVQQSGQKRLGRQPIIEGWEWVKSPLLFASPFTSVCQGLDRTCEGWFPAQRALFFPPLSSPPLLRSLSLSLSLSPSLTLLLSHSLPHSLTLSLTDNCGYLFSTVTDITSPATWHNRPWLHLRLKAKGRKSLSWSIYLADYRSNKSSLFWKDLMWGSD